MFGEILLHIRIHAFALLSGGETFSDLIERYSNAYRGMPDLDQI